MSLLQGRTPPALAGLRLSVTMPPLHEGRPLAQPGSREQQEASHGSSSPAAQQTSIGSSSTLGLPHQLPEQIHATAAPLQRQDGYRQQHSSQTEQQHSARSEVPGSAGQMPAAVSAAAQPSRLRLSNGGGGRSSRHAHFEDVARLSSSHDGGANAVSVAQAASVRPRGSSNADSSPMSNGSLASDLPPQSPPGSPPAPEVIAAAAASAVASVPPGLQAPQQRSAHPPLPGWPQHRRPGQRRAFSLAARSGSGASPRLGLEALLGVERSGYSGAGHICRVLSQRRYILA